MDKALKHHLQELRREALSFHRSQLEKMGEHDAMRQAYYSVPPRFRVCFWYIIMLPSVRWPALCQPEQVTHDIAVKPSKTLIWPNIRKPQCNFV